ncbi:MAG: hypothetical protein Q9191_005904, partial [Dirinaria sp. TL-2023a]
MIRPAARCLRRPRAPDTCILFNRTLSYTYPRHEEVSIEPTTPATSPEPPPTLDPNTIHTRREERLLAAEGRMPIGSRRRRAAVATTSQIPFEQLPYQCFQEARKILAADREIKLEQIAEQRKRIAKVEATDVSKLGGEVAKKGRLVAMRKYLEELKILADINDPLIKKRFEDGMGDMNRPIYRHLADKQWRAYRRKVQLQRITQMNIVPDILPHLDMTAEVTVAFERREIAPGAIVDSRLSRKPAELRVQVFDKGTRLVSIAVVDPDVPNTATDGFDYCCHFLAVNIPLSPAHPSLPLKKLTRNQSSRLVLPWLPPFAQKGSPYHRLAVFVLQQQQHHHHQEEQELDAEAIRNKVPRDGFKLRSFMDQFQVSPIGAALFRTVWDENTSGVMTRAGIEGANV